MVSPKCSRRRRPPGWPPPPARSWRTARRSSRSSARSGRVYIHDTSPRAKKFFERSASRGLTPSGAQTSLVSDVIGTLITPVAVDGCRRRAGCDGRSSAFSRLRSSNASSLTISVPPCSSRSRSAFSAAGFIATSTLGSSPGVVISWSRDVHLEAGHAVDGAGWGADLGGELGQRRQVVAERGAHRGESVARELHAVAGVACEPDHQPVDDLGVMRRRADAVGPSIVSVILFVPLARPRCRVVAARWSPYSRLREKWGTQYPLSAGRGLLTTPSSAIGPGTGTSAPPCPTWSSTNSCISSSSSRSSRVSTQWNRMSDGRGHEEPLRIGGDQPGPLVLREREPHRRLVAAEGDVHDLLDAQLDAPVHDGDVRPLEVLGVPEHVVDGHPAIAPERTVARSSALVG